MRSERASVIHHAGSVLAGQLAVMAFGVTDTVVAGRFSDTALAVLSVGSAIYISVYVSLIGIVQALLPVYAELHGARRTSELGHALGQTLYLCAFLFAAGVGLMLLPGPLLHWAQVPVAAQPEIRAYLAVLAAAFAPSLLFRAYATLNQAIGHPLLVTWVQLGALCVKLPLSIWFVAGGAGVPPLGAVGCAWATLVVNYLMLALAAVLLRTQAVYQPLNLRHALERPHWARIMEYARLGVPSGLSTMIEVTSFTLMALFIARLGTVASASHQIAVSVAAMLYMFPLSLGIASSARVSYWMGAGRPERARHCIAIGFQLTAICALTLAALLWFAQHFWASLFSSSPEIVTLASGLLGWVALFHLADATQCVSVFILRCYRITIAPMFLYGVFLWFMGLAGGYWLSYHGAWAIAAWRTPSAFWAAGTLSLWCVAALFVWMLTQAARRAG